MPFAWECLLRSRRFCSRRSPTTPPICRPRLARSAQASGINGRRSACGSPAPSGSCGCSWRSICLAAALFAYARRGVEAWKDFWGRTSRNSLRFFVTLAACSLAVYLPMAVAFGSMHWSAFGPFSVQTSRILHYALYFFVGIALGGLGLEQSVVREGGPLARRWIAWPIVALVAFALAAGIAISAATSPGATTHWEAIGSFGFVLSCAASSCAMLALFLRFARRPNAVGDSLRDNAYGIFLVHYAFVSWLQYSLLASASAAASKAALVTAGALALSWATESGGGSLDSSGEASDVPTPTPIRQRSSQASSRAPEPTAG